MPDTYDTARQAPKPQFVALQQVTLIDLPGYGYAASAWKRTHAAWGARMHQYPCRRNGVATTREVAGLRG